MQYNDGGFANCIFGRATDEEGALVGPGAPRLELQGDAKALLHPSKKGLAEGPKGVNRHRKAEKEFGQLRSRPALKVLIG